MKTLTQLARDVETARQQLDDAITALRAATEEVAAGAGVVSKAPKPRAQRSNMKRRGEAGVLTESLVREYHAKGLNDVAIATSLGVSPRRVQRMRSALGLKGMDGRPKKPTDSTRLPKMDSTGMPKIEKAKRSARPETNQLRRRIRDLVGEGLDDAAIAQQVGIAVKRVQIIKRKLGIKTKQPAAPVVAETAAPAPVSS